jgi:hypothetical protein
VKEETRAAWRTTLASIARLQHEKPPGYEHKVMKLVEKLLVLYKKGDAVSKKPAKPLEISL